MLPQCCCRAAILVVAALAWSDSIRAADESVVLEIASKLDVKTRVVVRAASNVARMPALDRMTEACIDNVPKLRLALDQGNAVYLMIPLRHVKKVTADAAGHEVATTDGSFHKGQLLTVVTGMDGKTHDLAAAAAIVNPAPEDMKKPDLKRARLTLDIAKPTAKTYEVHPPKICTERAGFDAFTMTLDGERIQAKISDFDKVVMVKKDKDWRIVVKATGGAEKTGLLFMRNGWWFLGCETTNGCAVLLRGRTEDARFPDNPGFTLERPKATSPEK